MFYTKILKTILISGLIVFFIIPIQAQNTPKVGEQMLEIKQNNPEGMSISLSSFKGKVVLVDFWASWSAPSRLANRNLAKIYQKYKDRNFTIFSISLDENKNNWIRAIETDKLVWKNHVSEQKKWENTAVKALGITEIPANFLIDATGKILAVNVDLRNIDELLEKQLK